MDINPERFVLSVLSDDAFVLINKKLLRYLKGDGSAAVFLGELISMHKYNMNNQTLELDNSFPCLTRRISYAVGLSEYKQHRILDKFKECNLCKVQLKGFPASKYVALNFDLLSKILADDDLKYKKIDAQQFYNDLNITMNQLGSAEGEMSSKIENAERSCDNMGGSLKGTHILISKHFASSGGLVSWTPELTGKIRYWVRNRGLGKPFDFTIITRTLGGMSVPKGMLFPEYVNEFIKQAKATQDIHFSNQVYEYRDLLTTN
jgi:hypothetical protein